MAHSKTPSSDIEAAPMPESPMDVGSPSAYGDSAADAARDEADLDKLADAEYSDYEEDLETPDEEDEEDEKPKRKITFKGFTRAAALIVWTIAMTAWTAGQVIQNVFWIEDIRGLNLGSTPAKGQAGTALQASATIENWALWIIMGAEGIVALSFVALSASLMWVPAVKSCKTGGSLKRMKYSYFPWLSTLLLVGTAWCKLFATLSIVNKMQAQGMWCAPSSSLDLAYTLEPKAEVAVLKGCSQSWIAQSMRQTMTLALITVGVHMGLFFLHQPRGITAKIFGCVPAVVTAGLLVAKPTTSLINWYFTQSHFTAQQDYTFTAEEMVSLLAFLSSVWLSIYTAWCMYSVGMMSVFSAILLRCRGLKPAPVDDDTRSVISNVTVIKRLRMSAFAAISPLSEQIYFEIQIPAIVGVLAPIITYFNLKQTSWWILADLIAGGGLMVIYAIMCCIHRRFLPPPRY